MSKLKAQQKSLYDFFSKLEDGKCIIPDYQRPYEWEAGEQCAKMWDDIIENFETNPEEDYFLVQPC